MPKDTTIQSVLVIGSGPIVIGQAAEFDYSGTQGCLALKEEGVRVILLNNNPATMMTDQSVADAVYLEPLTVDTIEKIIQLEQPDGIIASLGGQTALNLAIELAESGLLTKYGVRLLGTPIASIQQGENRELFRQLMHDLQEPVPESEIVHSVAEAVQFANAIGYPIIVRPAYTLGGSGGGIAHDEAELVATMKNGLAQSPIQQCLVERSIAGFKEIEYEVMRDALGTCITICNMENIDPVGVHTGDSVVIAPSQTLTDREYQMLRTASLKIIDSLGIVGGCNIQFALDPYSAHYYLIEVNPRVSRSSALASKATGYPIARMTAKIALGYHLHELLNPVTGHTYASFEPALDYVVVKLPRFPFDKFPQAVRKLGTQMKATGEVMAMDQNMMRAFFKAFYSLETKEAIFLTGRTAHELWTIVHEQGDERLQAMMTLLAQGISLEAIHEATKIDYFFLRLFAEMVTVLTTTTMPTTAEQWQQVKECGLSDAALAQLWNVNELTVRRQRQSFGVVPKYKMVDTCAAEFSSETAYFYSSYVGTNESFRSTKKKALILGSGPIRIGQGIEFDYSTVHAVQALKQAGYETILVNNNPETVSTDYATADKLYFEPLTLESVLDIIDLEQIDEVFVQFGGQTAISLAKPLEQAGITLTGTSASVIDRCEDRDLFYQLLTEVDVPFVEGKVAQTESELFSIVKALHYPILLRPSYCIGGRGMFIIESEAELLNVVDDCEFPILVDRYVRALEVEVDAVSDGTNTFIPTIMEHIERAGVHSGDSFARYDAPSLTANEREQVMEATKKIANALQYKGLYNLQFIVTDGIVYCLEVNPRASRTVPFITKVANVPLVDLAIEALLGRAVVERPFINVPFVAVKYPVFSTHKLVGVDAKVGPEMKSTGEGMAVGHTLAEAAWKIFHQEKSYYRSLDKEDVVGRAEALRNGQRVITEEETEQLWLLAQTVSDVTIASLQAWASNKGESYYVNH